MDSQKNTTDGKRLAYVALPGLSMASLLANLAYLQYGSSRSSPVILLDIHDYNRLQAIALKEKQSPWNQSLAMAYGHLFRRGVVQLIDYSNFYMAHTQKRIVKQNRDVLDAVSSDTQQRAAIDAAKGRINYQRGEYQESFREKLGEDLDIFIGGRKTEESRQRKLKRGILDPVEWNVKVLNQYAAALEVRSTADEIFEHLNVRYVIGEGESAIAGCGGIVGSAIHLPDQSRILDHNPRDLKHTREAFESIGEVVTEITGVQHDDWVHFSPTLAIPQYNNLFDIYTIQNEIESGLNKERVSREVIEVINILERLGGGNPDMSYTAEYLAENEIMPFAKTPARRQEIMKITNHAATLARVSNEIRPLISRGDISQVAGLIGVSLVCEPNPHDNLERLYQQGESLIDKLHPPSINQTRLTAIRRRKKEWDSTLDWYEKIDRAR